MNEMKTNEALASFESEYARLYESLYKAHRNEKELSEQCISLKVNISFRIRERNLIIKDFLR